MTSVIDKYTDILGTSASDLSELTISTEELQAIMALAGKTKKEKKSRKTKDPNKPKRPMSAFFFFKDVPTTRTKFKNDHPELWDVEGQKPKKMTEYSKYIGKLWNKMGGDEREPYDVMAAEAKEEFQTKMKEYTPTARIVIPEADVPDAPEGWSGPFMGYYCASNANGRKTFKTLNEAVEATLDMEDCHGITRNAKGKYSLRKMEGGKPLPTEKGDISWAKGKLALEDDVEVVDAPSPKVATTKNPVMKISSENSQIEDMNGDDNSDDESVNGDKYIISDSVVNDGDGVDPFGAESDNDGETGEPFGNCPDEEDDDDSEDDDGSDDDSPEVEGWSYGGTDYLVDPANGTVYDRSKFVNKSEVVDVGKREPNNSSGKFVPN